MLAQCNHGLAVLYCLLATSRRVSYNQPAINNNGAKILHGPKNLRNLFFWSYGFELQFCSPFTNSVRNNSDPHATKGKLFWNIKAFSVSEFNCRRSREQWAARGAVAAEGRTGAAIFHDCFAFPVRCVHY